MKKIIFVSLLLLCLCDVENGQTFSGGNVTSTNGVVNAKNLPGSGAWINLDSYAKGDLKEANCSFTASSWSITCGGAGFTSADVGKIGLLEGAAKNGSGATATTSIISAYTLAQAYASSGGMTRYDGTFSPIPIAGTYLAITGFTNAPNNVSGRVVSANSGTVFILSSTGVNETHAGTATPGGIGSITVTNAGSGYLSPPNATITGLTCTYNPEIKANLSGSNFSTGNTVTSVTVVFQGFGCTGTPTVAITAAAALDLPMTIASIGSGTAATLTNTSSIQPSVSGSGNFIWGTDDGVAINNALQTFASNTNMGVNPTGVICDRIFLTSTTINLVNKTFGGWMSPGPGNFSNVGASNLGCGFMLLNQSYTAPTNVIELTGEEVAHMGNFHIYSSTGNEQTSGMHLETSSSLSTDNVSQYVLFQNIAIGSSTSGDPAICSPFGGGRACPQFQYGIIEDLPNNNDASYLWDNIIINGAGIGFYQKSDQTAGQTFRNLQILGGAIGMKITGQSECFYCIFTGVSDADFVLGDSAQGGSFGIQFTLDSYQSIFTHQMFRTENGNNNIALVMNGSNIIDTTEMVGGMPITSGTMIDFTNAGGFVTVDASQPLGGVVSPTGTAPINFIWNNPASTAGAYVKFRVPGLSPPASSNIQIINQSGSAANNGFFQQDWFTSSYQVGSGGQFCHTNQPLFSGGIDPDLPECNNTTVLGKLRVFGEILGTSAGTVAGTSATKLSGTGSTTYYYEVAAVAGGKIAPASNEASVGSQNASLSASAVNQVCWGVRQGAQAYNIYEATTSGMEKLLATVKADEAITTVSSNSCYNDAAGGASGAAPPTVDGTGGAVFAGPVTLPNYTVSGLPSATVSGVGAEVVVTDATSFTIGTCTGGGSDTVLAISSGSAWVCQ